MSFFSGLANAITGTLPMMPFGIGEGYTAGQNLEHQKNVFRYQKKLQDRIFDREDTSVQRRVTDLKAAGLSPTLAAGSGAGAGQAINVSAPQRGQGHIKPEQVMAMMQMKANIAKTVSEQVLTRQLTNESMQKVDNLIASKGKTNLDAATLLHNLKIYRNSDTPKDASPVGKILRDLIGGGTDKSAIDKLIKMFQGKVDSTVNQRHKNRERERKFRKDMNKRRKQISIKG